MKTKYLGTLILGLLLSTIFSCKKPDDTVNIDPTLEKFKGSWLEYSPCLPAGFPCKSISFNSDYTLTFEGSSSQVEVEFLDNNQLNLSGHYHNPYDYFINDSILIIYGYYNQNFQVIDYEYVKQ